MAIQEEAGTARPVRLITVQVSFPVSVKGPYRAQVPPQDTISSVRLAAMGHFEVSDGADYAYVLTHGGRDVPDAETVEQVAGEKDLVEFRLVKKVVQG